MSDKEESQQQAADKAAAGRGPSYPVVSLQEAIARIKRVYEEEGKALAPTGSAVKHWGFSEKSSGGRQMTSTLLQYGLLRDEGRGDQRRVAVTKLALDILLLQEGAGERAQAIKKAARSPKLYNDLLAHYSEGLPSDATLRHYMVTQRDISPGGVDLAIKNLRANISYAKLLSSDNLSDI